MPAILFLKLRVFFPYFFCIYILLSFLHLIKTPRTNQGLTKTLGLIKNTIIMLSDILTNKTKKYIKPLIKNYCKLFPNQKITLDNREFSYNLKANTYFPFKQNKNVSKKEGIINYNIASRNLYLEIGQKTYDGMHSLLENLYPTACSWAPYYENQSNLVFTNFLSTHYGLNSPQIILLRYESIKEGASEVVNKYKTLVVLPEQTIWFNENFNSNAEGNVKGQLHVYVFDPLFKPVESQIRYHVIYENNSNPTCGVHSWLSVSNELVISHNQFLSRRFVPDFEKENEYYSVPPFGKIIKCLTKDNKTNINSNNDSLITLPNELTPEKKTQRGGFFVNLDSKKKISRIWHDNGTGNAFTFQVNGTIKKEIRQTDFCFPLKDYYFNIITPNPVSRDVVVNAEMKISAFGIKKNELFLQKKIESSDLIKHQSKLFSFEIKLKKFFKELNELLSENQKNENEFVRINIEYTTETYTSNDELKDEIISYLYMYDNKDNVCDQIHNEFTSGSIHGGKKFKSYRTNKFAPFKLKENCNSYIILKNKFTITEDEKKLDHHKIRVTINYSTATNGEKVYSNKTEYLKFNIKDKFLIINLNEIFFKDEINLSNIYGGVHIFCSTLNSWSYWMIKSRNREGRNFLACDHLTGG